MGLGGSMEYIPKADNQYTERAMAKRIRKMRWKLWKHKGFDILVTHAPAYQFHDMEDLPHRGFACFRGLMEKYRPKLFVHGHVHANMDINIILYADTPLRRLIRVHPVMIPSAREKRGMAEGGKKA